ncbi:MAG: hypothetical protein ACIAQ0_05585 [Phycisphaerales bacterium JB058]
MKKWTTIGRALMLGLAMTGQAALAQDEAPAEPAPATEQTELPSAESLFERHIEAVGGKDKVFDITTRRFTATLKFYQGGSEEPAQTSILRITAKAPDLMIQEIITPGVSTITKYFDGDAGWVVEQGKPAVAMEVEELERFAVGARFYAEADYKNHYKGYKTVNKQEVNGDTIYIVEIEHFSGRKEALAFSDDSGLIIGVAGMRTIQGRQFEFRRSYEDYSDFGDGVLYAKTIREVMGGTMFEIVMTSIDTDIDFPELERPEGIEDADLSGFRKE